MFFSFISLKDSFSFMLVIAILFIWLSLNFISLWIKNSLILINFMGLILTIFFYTNNVWKFFLEFEIIMLPMIFMIIGWGQNLSRISSSFYMLIYTLFFSLPVIFMIFMNFKIFMLVSLLINNYYMSLNSIMWIMLMFMVKIPVFGLHYWLPKAHVEASTVGSMILAGGLLKMGMFGLTKVALWSGFFIWSSWMVLGSMMAALFCCIQSDFKKLVALSSVSHMTLGCGAFMSELTTGFMSMIIISFTHSMVSSVMFLSSGILFSVSKTRMIYYYYKLTMFYTIFVIIMMSNMGVPPAYSFIAEILSMTSIFLKNFMFSMFMFMLFLLSLIFFFYCISNISMTKLDKSMILPSSYFISMSYMTFMMPLLFNF